MSEMNRTVQSIRNARVSLFFSVLVLVLGFFSRKILIDCLGEIGRASCRERVSSPV